MILDHRKYALFNYEQNPSKDDKFVLGSVVTNDNNEVGVIIQCHGNDEYRTDMFGNCCYDESGKYGNIKLSTKEEILKYREKLITK